MEDLGEVKSWISMVGCCRGRRCVCARSLNPSERRGSRWLVPCVGGCVGGGVSYAESLTREQIQQRLASPPADFKNLEAPGANLSGIDFAGASLFGANLKGANLSDANLAHCNLNVAILRDAVLVNADLREAKLFSSVLAHADLSKADLRGARLMGNFERAKLEGANLERVQGGADMRNQPMGLVRLVLAGARLKGARLAQANLSRADLSYADLREADLSGVDLTRAKLVGADFTGATLTTPRSTERKFTRRSSKAQLAWKRCEGWIRPKAATPRSSTADEQTARYHFTRAPTQTPRGGPAPRKRGSANSSKTSPGSPSRPNVS